MESPTIGKLADALSKAQGEMQNAAKDKDNPFFKSTYADLASVWDACRGPLSKNGLSVIQPYSITESGRVLLTTKLLHVSGEWISSEVIVTPVKADPQGLGSAMTYMRRFCLSALVGIAPEEKPTENDVDEDDDGNAASGKLIAQHPVNIISKIKEPVASKEKLIVAPKSEKMSMIPNKVTPAASGNFDGYGDDMPEPPSWVR